MMYFFLLAVFWLYVGNCLHFKISEKELLQKIDSSPKMMKQTIVWMMANNQIKAITSLLKMKTFDFQSEYDLQCNEITEEYLISLRATNLSKEDLRLLMSSDCMAQMPSDLLPFALDYEGNILESEALSTMLPNANLIEVFLDRAFANEERSHLLKWDVISWIKNGDLALSIIKALNKQESWQVITPMNFDKNTLFFNTELRRTKLIETISGNEEANSDSTVLRMISLLAIWRKFDFDLSQEAMISNRATLNLHVNPSINLIQAELKKLYSILDPSKMLFSKIAKLPAHSEETLREILELTSKEIVYSDWFLNLFYLIDLRNISISVLISLLDQMFATRLTSACLAQVFEMLNEAKTAYTEEIMRLYLLQYPQHITELYEKYREAVPNLLVIELIPFKERVLYNLRRERRPEFYHEPHFIECGEGLEGLAGLISELYKHSGLGLMDSFFKKSCAIKIDKKVQVVPITIQEMIISYFEMFLAVPALYNLHGKTFDDRPIISLSLKFAPRFWGQLANLIAFSFILKEKLPFVLEERFFYALLDARSSEFVEEDATGNEAIYKYLERNSEFLTFKSRHLFIRHWANLISPLSSRGERSPLEIEIPTAEIILQYPASRINRLFLQAKLCFQKGIDEVIRVSDFTPAELYLVLFPSTKING